MLKWLGSLVDSNEKELNKLRPLVQHISSLEPAMNRLTDAELRAKTDEFKARLAEGETLDDILPEAFAATREAARRTIGERPFDVQLMGGMVLHQGKISEMKTGEGKTLVAPMPLYLNALAGKGCHLVTVNDYLAKRDPHWMGPVYHALGMSVASIQHEASFLYDPDFDSGDPRWKNHRPVSRRQAYEADITYGTNNEFGFDYLRDNMVVDLSQCAQRPLNYAIVDEVDNILIDEARTPLIISGMGTESAKVYQTFAGIAPQLGSGEDFKIDEKTRTVSMTEAGLSRVEEMLRNAGLLKGLNLYDPANYNLTIYLENALRAQFIFKKDRDYVVKYAGKENQVIIVDEFTGRLMFGRRYSEGLHQAIEAKEGVRVQPETTTMATITFQNYFRLYQKLAGMTGTAVTEAEEFHKIYKLEVVVIPTNKPMARTDHPDQIYKTEEGKFRAVVREVEKLNQEKRPVLIGTVSIEKNEHLSEMLRKGGVPHQVLNAKHHEKEAAILAQAGQPGMVTVATNMAGRGVDITLGGKEPDRNDANAHAEWQKYHEQVVASGGLHVIGTERHEARRIDNQLRGRAGRQGDPGSSRFYVSLEDDIMRRFGGDRLQGIMQWVGMDEDTPIEHSLVSRAIEGAQVRVEGYHFDLRKHLVDYDDVVNKHREVIYTERKKILSGADLKANIHSMVEKEIGSLVAAAWGGGPEEARNTEGLVQEASSMMPLSSHLTPQALSNMNRDEVEEALLRHAVALYEEREQKIGPEATRVVERLVMLRSIDTMWVEHLTQMDHVRQGIGLRAVGQSDPLVVYKKEGHALFQSLLANIQHEVAYTVFKVEVSRSGAPEVPASPMAKEARARNQVAAGAKSVGRNDPCPCGSGLKYKKCHGK
ncbi:MAG: preprotein translocase subunit SecA [Dehalococcoidia bacterium]|nr:preprotein translocase subunit SecA [Dehalococcoidia bacterium]